MSARSWQTSVKVAVTNIISILSILFILIPLPAIGIGGRWRSANPSFRDDRKIDFADAALVRLANDSGLRDILTVDETDFAVYRLKGGRRFALVKWFD